MVCTLDPIRTWLVPVCMWPGALLSITLGRIKLIDFGSACAEFHMMHTYIQSRFYRWGTKSV